MNQEIAPLLEAARNYLGDDRTPFYMPGHKRGYGIDPEFAALMGSNLFRLDLPELPGLSEAIAASEELAADAYGADHTWFLVNGSTCGIQAMLLATCQPGDKILVGRNCHKSTIAALILSGAMPVYLGSDYDATLELDLGVTPNTLKSALEKHPDAKAAFVVSPNYFGVCGEIEELVAIAHSHGIPLLVDAAHGAHLHFHPDLPISAVAAGADLVVQSTHKVNSALTQAAMLHLRGELVTEERVSQALQLLQSTSPNFLLLTSLDVARRQMALYGKELLTTTLRMAERARSQIQTIPNLTTCDRRQISTLDPTRLTVAIAHLGITGFEADVILYERLGVIAEMSTFQHLVFVLTYGNSDRDIGRLVAGLGNLAQEQARGLGQARRHCPYDIPSQTTLNLPSPISPREAFFAPSDHVEFKLARDRISTELVCPYPPGIPVIYPGETITGDAIDFVLAIKNAGGTITGCSDPTLTTIRVIAKKNGS